MGKLTSEQLAAAAGDAAEEVRVHAMKILAERPEWSEADRKLAVAGLQDDNGFVARAAADALARHPRAEFLQPILQRLSRTSDSDNHLRYVLRMAVRDHLATSDDLNAYLPKEIAPADRRVLVDLALVVKSNAAARFLARQIATESIPEATVVAICSSVAATAPTEEIVPFIRDLRQKYGPRTDFSLALIDALTTGRQKQGPQIVPELGDWALEAARQTFTSPEQAGLSWSNHAVEGKPASDDPWVVQARPSADGDTQALFFGSLPKGEQRTGINRSQPFALPETLSFYCAGHSGPPGQKKKANFIRLRDAANHELLMESPPAWNDIAQRVEWDLNKFAGRRGYVELVDADDANAYAWIAVGRFSLAGLNPNGAADARRRAVQLVGQHNLADLTQDVAAIGTHAETDRVTRQTCVQTLLKLRPRPLLAAMTPVMTDGDLAVDFAVRIARLAVQGDGAAEAKLLRDIARELPARLHTTMAENLAGDRRGALELVALVDEGRMSAHLLRSPNVNNKFKAMGDAELNALVERLVATLPPADAALDKLLADRRKLQSAAKPDMLRGQEHFKKHCAVCHQVAGQGAVIGPQLDGIGLRGVERLLEDVLDPNRNVDVAFRTTLLALADGKVVSVLVRREEGETLVAVDAQGKEVRIGKADVEKQSRSTLSLMPANVAEILPPEELPHLIGYLASLREKKE
jgi:putative heme-binding domain-containing protein